VEIITKDILTVKHGIIAHQANCKGSMGAGLAKQIRDKYPKVFREYQKAFHVGGLTLGSISTTQVKNNLWIINLMAQDHYKGTPPLTDYEALEKCLRQAVVFAETVKQPLYLPYKLGCGLAGGDWDTVLAIIEKVARNAIICKLP